MKDFLYQHHWIIWVIIIICLWDSVWKLIAMWRAARLKKLGWFILLAIFNTIGVLPIMYLLYEKRGKRLGKEPVTTA